MLRKPNSTRPVLAARVTPESTISEDALRAVPWLAVLFIALWIGAGTVSSTGQWGDHLEQFVWAHGIEWGYHKHPPLPTWMLAASISMFGPSTSWAYALAALCLLGTASFTYRIALDLLGQPVATLALMLWGLQQPFSNRAHLFNHNTVMMLCVSATAWCLLKALRPSAGIRWWMATGVLAGLALLAKYQAVVPLAGFVLAAWLSGELASKQSRAGMLSAMLVGLAVFLPHVAWVFQHDLTTIGYAAQEGRALSWSGRAWSVTSFLAQQLRLVFPALLFAGLVMLLPRLASAPRTTELDPAARRRRAWLFGLIGFPLAITVLTSPVLGLHLQNHWGYQALQFASFWLAWHVHRHISPAHLSWVALLVLLHVVLLGLAFHLSGLGKGSRQDADYPAQALADAVHRDWQDDTSCPLAYVVGPTFEAGIVSVYNGGTAAVVEDGNFSKSPWIGPLNVQRKGAVYVAGSPRGLPTQGVTRIGSLDVGSASPAPRDRVYWAIVPPEKCLATDP